MKLECGNPQTFEVRPAPKPLLRLALLIVLVAAANLSVSPLGSVKENFPIPPELNFGAIMRPSKDTCGHQN
jgi:hypothetical protein